VNGTPLKNSVTWLTEFLRIGNFQFTCDACHSAGNTVTVIPNTTNAGAAENAQLRSDIANLHMSFKAMSGNIGQLTQQLSEIQHNLMCSAAASPPPSEDGSKTETAAAPAARCSTYAGMVSSSIAESVKKAVAATIKERDSAARDKASMMIYGLPENRRDTREVDSVLKAISACSSFSTCIRLGREDNGQGVPRPLKVVFDSVCDRDAVLRAAKNLKGHGTYGKLRLSRFLSAEEMEKVKEARARCKQLNDAASTTEAGKKPYFVINGKIVSRGADGKFVYYQQSTTKTKN
jgi:hypothetical protein